MISTIQRLLKVREVPVFLALVLVIVITGLANPRFFSISGVQDITLGVAVIAILAVAQSFVIVMRHIDLSVGSTIGFSAFLIGYESSKGAPLWWCVLSGLLLGVGVGVLNGFLVAYLKLPSLVVTLSSLYLVRGIFNEIAGGTTITNTDVPPFISFLGRNYLLGIPYLFIIAAVLMVIGGLVMRNLSWARDLYAIGSNPSASPLVGIPVARRTFTAFVITGGMAGLAGAILLARFNTAAANSGAGLELNVVAACVVGGVAIAGGLGTPFGAVIGAVLLQAITLALGALGVPQFWQQAVNGILLISAISLDRYLSSRVKPTQIMRVNA